MTVTIYTKDNCPHCVGAKNLLLLKGKPYNEIKIGSDIMREQFLENFPHVKTVPYIIIDGSPVGGFSDLKEYFENDKQFLTE